MIVWGVFVTYDDFSDVGESLIGLFEKQESAVTAAHKEATYSLTPTGYYLTTYVTDKLTKDGDRLTSDGNVYERKDGKFWCTRPVRVFAEGEKHNFGTGEIVVYPIEVQT